MPAQLSLANWRGGSVAGKGMRQLTERKPRIKISNFFLHGYGETDWRILPAADQDYRKQVTAWDRREFTDARGARRTAWWCPQGRPDHYDSCELMQIACASARGLLSAPREVGPLFEHAAGQNPS